MEPVHEYPERHIHPVTYVHPEQVVVPEAQSEVQVSTPPPRAGLSENAQKTIRETIPEPGQKQFPEQFGNNSPNNSETIRTPETQPAPQAAIAPYKKKGKVGRQRRYEEAGLHGEIPVKEVVLFRHIKGRHWPGMSQDMREWYEYYYFSRPKKTERAKDAEDYNRHAKSWERGQRWIAEYEASQGRTYQPLALGDSRKIVAYRKRATS